MQINETLQTVTQELLTRTQPQPPPILSESFLQWLGFQVFDDDQLRDMATACRLWVDAFKENRAPRWISFLGTSGTGKTHCASKLWNWSALRSNWAKTEYARHGIFWPDFVQKLRAGHSFQLRDDLKRWPVLFLDDIGAERDPSGFASEELNTLLSCRMGKWTIITSNKGIEGLRSIDARISSRLIRDNNICLEVNSADYSIRL